MKSLAIGVLAGIAVTLLLALDAPDRIELPVRDAAARLLPRRPATSTAIVAIDEPSIERFGPWPWERARLAAIVNRAADAGARGIVFDILLVDARDGDEHLATALRRVPSVAVALLADDGKWRFPAPPIRDAARMGHGNFEFDADGILRRFSATKQSGDRALTALAIEAASLARATRVPVGRAIAPAFRTRPRDVPQVSAADLLDGRPVNVGRVLNPSTAAKRPPTAADGLENPSHILRGRIVFIGLTAVALGDRVLTPVSRDAEAGVTVQAASAESVIRGEEIRDLPPIAAGVLAAAIAWPIVRFARFRRLLAGALALLVIGAGVLLIATTGIAIPMMTLVLLIAIMMTADIARSLRLTRTAFREHRVQEAESKRVLAHELKTPLASMRGLTQLLGGFELTDAERKRVATLLETEADKLQLMVSGLLDLERLPLRDFAASTSVTDLGKLVAARVDFLRTGTDRPLVMHATPNVLVRTDSALVERVVDNLVGNALKYAEGPVDVAVRKNGDGAVLEVADHGAGLSPADRERIFQRFFRGSSAAGAEGLGLGLSLVAEIAKWHGGSASVDAAESGGSLFRVTFGGS
jgi:signal transduction histidine kinase